MIAYLSFLILFLAGSAMGSVVTPEVAEISKAPVGLSVPGVPEIYTDASWHRFNDLYSESTGISGADTIASYLQLRSGWQINTVWQAYAVARLGADSRTLFENSSSVYNDNAAFLGLGLDYLGILPGVRLTGQVGGSMDLTTKIQKGGFDFRTGFMTYHELNLARSDFNMEFYSDGFYIRRYDNTLVTSQIRLLYDRFKFSIFENKASDPNRLIEISPMVNVASSIDTAGLDYNRFVEARFGFRVRTRTAVSVMLNPYYVCGFRWQGTADQSSYNDVRLLLALYAAF